MSQAPRRRQRRLLELTQARKRTYTTFAFSFIRLRGKERESERASERARKALSEKTVALLSQIRRGRKSPFKEEEKLWRKSVVYGGKERGILTFFKARRFFFSSTILLLLLGLQKALFANFFLTAVKGKAKKEKLLSKHETWLSQTMHARYKE